METAAEPIVRVQTEETWLICGGRDFTNREIFDRVLFKICATRGLPKKILHGAAKGADYLAGDWGKQLGLEVTPVPALWSKYGTSAGPRRNEAMLVEHSPDLVVAFPGGRGTADMLRRAQSAGVTVIRVQLTEEEPE